MTKRNSKARTTGDKDYYAHKLFAAKLRMVYDIASPRIKQYLNAEIDFVRDRIRPGDRVLELGCGYGRVLAGLVPAANSVFGIDKSIDSLLLAKHSPRGRSFRVDRGRLMAEAARVTRPDGKLLFSSYADIFWPERLAWFRAQADQGLLGEIDEAATGDGIIVCKDGFRSATVRPTEFKAIAVSIGLKARISTVDASSVFCEITIN